MTRHVPARELHLRTASAGVRSSNIHGTTVGAAPSSSSSSPSSAPGSIRSASAATTTSSPSQPSLSTQTRDLLDPSLVTDSLKTIPGFRTSAAFFTFLRANLVLPPTTSTTSSNTSTPMLDPASSQTLAPPSPSPLSNSMTLDPANAPSTEELLADVAPLREYVLTDAQEKIDGVKLIADSVAQMRQAASRAIIFNPITVALWLIGAAILFQYQYVRNDDLGVWLTSVGGGSMCILALTRMLSSPYLAQAEAVNWEILTNDETGEEDLLIGAKFGTEIIGAAILRLEGAPTKKKAKVVKSKKGIIRAWTVRLRYRHKGIGTGILEECVRVTREKLGRDAEVGFSSEHVNSKMILPNIFNGPFKRNEAFAIKKLGEVERSPEVSLSGKKKR